MKQLLGEIKRDQKQIDIKVTTAFGAIEILLLPNSVAFNSSGELQLSMGPVRISSFRDDLRLAEIIFSF